MSLNAIANCKNPYQGDFRKVLCVCSAGLLRSPTIAWVLSNPPYNYNTRAVGIEEEFALIPLFDTLLHWADEIVVVDALKGTRIEQELLKMNLKKPVVNLDLPDVFPYRDPKLVELVSKTYDNNCV